MNAQLELESYPEMIGAATDFSYKWCLNAGLPEEDAVEFTLALDELITDIILFAFPDEQGTFKITFKNGLSYVEAVVHELGEPFDPDRHQYDINKALQKLDFEGAGFKLIQEMSDNFTFINKGKEGKEFRLSKYIKDPHITDIQTELKRDTAPRIDTKSEHYAISTISADDAEDVARLIYRTYGHTYTKEEMYFPKKVERAIRQQDKLGVIVRTSEDIPVGYFAVLKIAQSRSAEVGEAVVSPDHRQRGLMTRMMKSLIDIAKKNGIRGLYGNATTAHLISQRVNYKYGFHSTALKLAESPPVSAKKLKEDYPQPISTIIDFKPLVARENLSLYIPSQYKKIIQQIYKFLGTRCHPLEIPEFEWIQKSDIQIDINYKNNSATLKVRSYGKNFALALDEIMKSLITRKLNTIFIDLPLEDPATTFYLDSIRNMGFIFSGILPMIYEDADFLRMQHPFVNLDFELIEVYSDLGKMLKKQVQEEYNECKAKRSYANDTDSEGLQSVHKNDAGNISDR